MKTDIGISEKNRKKITQVLSPLLADTYTLYLKTQNFHWNVTGRDFYELHLLFEKQYNELSGAIDELAERIRALDFPVHASFKQFIEDTQFKTDNAIPDSDKMLQQLAHDHAAICSSIRIAITNLEDTDDVGTIDLLTRRLQEHEKTVWMLKSSL